MKHSRFIPLCLLLIPFAGTVMSCGPDRSRPEVPDLPKRDDLWITNLALNPDTKVQFIGKTKDLLVTTSSAVRDLPAPPRLAVGDEIEGIRIGAIKCSFYWRDATYARQQFMWRGRWGCMAGRDRHELDTAVDDKDGTKRFDYIYLSPVTIPTSDTSGS